MTTDVPPNFPKKLYRKIPKDKKLDPEKIIFDWLHEPFNTAQGEQALWVAVIMQAMTDAARTVTNAEQSYHKHEAIMWLTGNSRSFTEVCLLAGFDPDYVRCRAKRALVSPIKWRALPGEGSRYHERKAYRQRMQALPAPTPTRNHKSRTLTLA